MLFVAFLQFVNVEATLTAEQRKVYDTAVHVWYVWQCKKVKSSY